MSGQYSAHQLYSQATLANHGQVSNHGAIENTRNLECSEKNCEPGWSTHVITYNCQTFKANDRKSAMHKLLHVEEGNLISDPNNPCPEGSVRYIHLPANNMRWVEVRQVI